MRRFHAVAVFALLLTFWLQMFFALPKLSATTDEVAHLPAGYSYWLTRDFRLNPEHPPLAKLLASLPLLALKPPLHTEWPEWRGAQQYVFGFGFLYTNDVDRLLFWGRIPMTLLAAAGAFITYLWARSMFGGPSGLFALALFAFSPNLLAHGMLVTTDVPLAAFMTLALYLVWKQGSEPTLMGSAGVGLAAGAAMASKFSGSIVPFIIIACSFWRFVSARNRSSQILVEAKCLAAAGLAALVLLEAAYLFRIAPWTYFENMRFVNANHNPIRLFYLFGNFSRTGWWYYFPAAFMVKATIPFLLTIASAAVLCAARGFRDARGEILILSTIVVYTTLLVIGADDIGMRYLLPLFPLLLVWGSRIIIELTKKTAGTILAIVLVAMQVRAALGAFPDYIPYFNEFAGGAAGGIRFLDDSNVDWGQGMKQAGEYVRRNHLEKVELLPFSPFDNPHYYGVQRPRRDDIDTYRMMISDHRPPGVYIVSAHHLVRMMYIRPEWDPANAIARIGNSLWVYKF